jgi:hypothetical protein
LTWFRTSSSAIPSPRRAQNRVEGLEIIGEHNDARWFVSWRGKLGFGVERCRPHAHQYSGTYVNVAMLWEWVRFSWLLVMMRRGRKGLLQWIRLHRLGVAGDSQARRWWILTTVIGARLGRGHRGSGQFGALNPRLDAGSAGLFHVDHDRLQCIGIC